MSLFNWFSKKTNENLSTHISQGAKDFIDGKKNTLTSADVNPEGATVYARFQKAMELKKEGKFLEAEPLLIKSTEPPSIYHGHYRELFKVWRQFNRNDLKAEKYKEVSSRVLNMYRLDNEMINEMLRYWSIQHEKKLHKNFFDKYRNLLIGDAKALKKSAESLQDEDSFVLSKKLIERFDKK